jgi:hypothetical protein
MAHTIGSLPARASSSSNPITVAQAVSYGESVMVVMLKTVGSTDRAGAAPSWNGTSLVQANSTQKAATSPEAGAELWYLLNPGNGAGTLTIPNTGSATIYYQVAFGKSATGRSKFNAASGGNATSTNPTPGAIASALAGDIVFAITAGGWTTWNPSSQAGTSISNDDDGAHGGGTQYSIRGSNGSFDLNWTFGTSDDWGAVAAAFSEEPNPSPGAFYRKVGPALPFAAAQLAITSTAPAANIFSYTAQGGILVSGASSPLRSKTTSSAGGIVLGGTSLEARVKITLTSGGITFSGTSTKSVGTSVTASGGITLSGTSLANRIRANLASGGIAIAGTSLENRLAAIIASGGIVLAGTSPESSGTASPVIIGMPVRTVGPGLPFSAKQLAFPSPPQLFSISSTGGISFGGSAGYSSQTLVIQGWIGRQMGPALDFAPAIRGFTNPVQSFSFPASGGMTLAGTSNLLRIKLAEPSGGINLAGTSPASSSGGNQQYSYVAQGGLVIAGSSSLIRRLTQVASGSVVFSGTSNYRSIVFGSATSMPDIRTFMSVMRKRR